MKGDYIDLSPICTKVGFLELSLCNITSTRICCAGLIRLPEEWNIWPAKRYHTAVKLRQIYNNESPTRFFMGTLLRETSC